jgi:hypothetical protein
VSKNAKAIKDPAPLFAVTGVDSLTPTSAILQVLHETAPDEAVKHHNVVGVVKEDVALEENTDGIVPYHSAHLVGVESEIVVPAHHIDLHRHPRTVLEVRRILKEHLAEVESRRHGDILQVNAPGHTVDLKKREGGSNQ